MKKTIVIEKNNQQHIENDHQKLDESATHVEVLYQKMGNRWYSFFVFGDDVYMGEVPENTINTIRKHRDS